MRRAIQPLGQPGTARKADTMRSMIIVTADVQQKYAPSIQLTCDESEAAGWIAYFHEWERNGKPYAAIALPVGSFLPSCHDVRKHDGKVF